MISAPIKRIVILTVSLLGLGQAVSGQNASPAEEHVRPGDLIRLYVWREKDMSGDFVVPQSGRVVFPVIGERDVLRLPKPQLRDSIISAMKVTVRNPSIEVTFLKRINILGAVSEPGMYNVDDIMTVASALALAGGIESSGKQDEVQLLRGAEVLRTRISRRTPIADLPLQSGDQLFVPERSWFSRNTPIVSALVSGLVSVTVALLVRN